MTRIQTLLVPFDLSERAAAAVREAAAIADKLDARLLLLHVESSLRRDYEGGEAPGEQEAYEAEELAHLAHEVAPDARTEFLLRQGDAADVIAEICRERRIDLVVMPTRGQGSYRRFLLGSTTAKVLHDAPCPVLTGAHAPDPGEIKPDYRRIACLVDLKADAKPLLTFARDFASLFDAELTAIHVTPSFIVDSAGADFLQTVQGSARLALERAVEQAGVTARIAVGGGGLETRLPKLLNSGKSDLLILSRNSGRPSDEILGVSAEAYAAIRSSPCPVLSL